MKKGIGPKALGSPFKQMNTTSNDKIYKGGMLDEVTVTAKKGALSRAVEFADDLATKNMAKIKKTAKGFNLDKAGKKMARNVIKGAALGRLAPTLTLTGDKRIEKPNFIARPPLRGKTNK